MKRVKKFLIPVLTAAFLMSGLTACGDPVKMVVDIERSTHEQDHSDEKNDISSSYRNEDRDSSYDDEDNDSSSSSSSNEDDVMLWVNGTYAVLTYLNGWDYMIYAGKKYNKNLEYIYQNSLEEWWGVEDRKTADETLDWVLNEGHREDFVSLMEILVEDDWNTEITGYIDPEDRIEFFYEYYELTLDEAEFLAKMYGYYEEYGPEAIDGWDYSRAVYLPSMYYLAGYYTEDEAKEKSLEIAKMIQKKYTSWDDFMESYFRGYEYWNEDSSDERRKAYEEIKADPHGPYSLDWNLDLSI